MQTCRDAEAGRNGFVAIFVPWFWQEEYRAEPPADFVLDAEERDYAALYGLDLAQMAWRRIKIGELKDPILFKQEYPANAAEAFQMSGHDSYIAPALIARGDPEAIAIQNEYVQALRASASAPVKPRGAPAAPRRAVGARRRGAAGRAGATARPTLRSPAGRTGRATRSSSRRRR